MDVAGDVQDEVPSSAFGMGTTEMEEEERSPSPPISSDEEEEEEDECRVCRGPAEKGRILFRPCKCSGSIALVHQDCLESWLAVKGGSGKCDLCTFKFKFAPQYAQGTPEHLPPVEVVSGLSLRFLQNWLPFAIRIMFVLSVWFGMLPLLTGYLYQCWMRGPSTIKERFGHYKDADDADGSEKRYVGSDVVSGLIITLVIIISFLSLMSLADFLRFQWQRNEHNGQINQDRNANRQRRNDEGHENDELDDLDEQDEEPPPPPEYDFRNLNLHIDDAEIAKRRRDYAAMPKREKPSNAVGIMEDGTPYYASDANKLNHKDLNINDTEDLIRFVRDRIEEKDFKESEENRLRDLTETLEQKTKSLHSENDEEILNHFFPSNYEEDFGLTVGYNKEQHNFKDDRKTEESIQLNTSSDDQMKTASFAFDTDDSDKEGKADLLNDTKIASLQKEEKKAESGQTHFSQNMERNVRDLTRSPSNSAIRRQREREYLQRAVLDTFKFDEDSENDLSNDNRKSPLHAIKRGGDSSSNLNSDDLNRMIQIQEQESMDEANRFLDEGSNEDSEIERMMQMQELEEEQREEDEPRHEGLPNQNPNIDDDRNERFEPQFEPLDPVINPDEEMDMHMPMDELIGLRGPVSALLRNLLWLLAFNAAYTGIFGCIPYVIGRFWYSRLSAFSVIVETSTFLFQKVFFSPFVFDETPGQNATDVLSNATYVLLNATGVSLNATDVLFKLNATSYDSKIMLKPSDVASMTLGYFSLALSMFIIKISLKSYRHLSRVDKDTSVSTSNQSEDHGAGPNRFRPNIAHRGEERMDDINGRDMGQIEIKDLIAKKIDAAIDCGCAIAKLGILLFLKMLFLPFLLGMWLDFSTLKLFDSSIENRIKFAGSDIFAFVLLHWVSGITFMLFVTVSVLQLREVVHPDILARFIRPQEPQPDLLGNILQDSAWTHTKRMLPSLFIYATLLGIHIWVPAQIFASFGAVATLQIVPPKSWWGSQLRFPLELFTFHFTMLALLEKHKNRIGELQHAWILKMCNLVGTTDFLLPRKVKSFKLVGLRPLFSLKSSQVDTFWNQLYELQKKGFSTDQFIEKEMQQFTPTKILLEEGSKKDGKRHLNYSRPYISLSPSFNPFSALPRASDQTIKRLPSSIGSYRFRRRCTLKEENVIECWCEVLGDLIPRPPDGWDDYLGDTGALTTGRWAWGDEKKSPIEKEVACRKEFFPTTYKNEGIAWNWKTKQFWISMLSFLLKSCCLYLCSWITICICTGTLIFGPLLTGRFLTSVCGIPKEHIHDPAVFLLGAIFLFPFLLKMADSFCRKDVDENNYGETIRKRLKAMLTPPRGKAVLLFQTLILCEFASPLLLGFTYDSFFRKDESFWKGEEFFSVNSIFGSWVVGFTFLHCWVGMCYQGVFHRNFWTDIGIFAVEGVPAGPENNHNNNNRGQGGGILNNPNRRNNHARGRVIYRDNTETAPDESSDLHSFVDTMNSVLLCQEWDKADRVILIDNFALPLYRRLMAVCMIPVLACACSFPIIRTCLSDTRIDGDTEWWWRMISYQMFTMVSVLTELCRAYRVPLRKWFKRAHKAARDHRYLVGEVLLNYTPVQNISESSSGNS